MLLAKLKELITKYQDFKEDLKNLKHLETSVQGIETGKPIGFSSSEHLLRSRLDRKHLGLPNVDSADFNELIELLEKYRKECKKKSERYPVSSDDWDAIFALSPKTLSAAVEQVASEHLKLLVLSNTKSKFTGTIDTIDTIDIADKDKIFAEIKKSPHFKHPKIVIKETNNKIMITFQLEIPFTLELEFE